MASNNINVRNFTYEDSAGDKYEVTVQSDGTGMAIKHGPAIRHLNRRDLPKTPITVDADALADWTDQHVTRIAREAVYNDGHTLEAVLNP